MNSPRWIILSITCLAVGGLAVWSFSRKGGSPPITSIGSIAAKPAQVAPQLDQLKKGISTSVPGAAEIPKPIKVPDKTSLPRKIDLMDEQAPVRIVPSETSPPIEILVDDFEVGSTQGLFAERKNRLDAFQGTWAKRPSYTVITKVPDSKPGRSGKVLRIEYGKRGGWCGWYTLLNGINVLEYNALTFWIKGEKGGGAVRHRFGRQLDAGSGDRCGLFGID